MSLRLSLCSCYLLSPSIHPSPASRSLPLLLLMKLGIHGEHVKRENCPSIPPSLLDLAHITPTTIAVFLVFSFPFSCFYTPITRPSINLQFTTHHHSSITTQLTFPLPPLHLPIFLPSHLLLPFNITNSPTHHHTPIYQLHPKHSCFIAHTHTQSRCHLPSPSASYSFSCSYSTSHPHHTSTKYSIEYPLRTHPPRSITS